MLQFCAFGISGLNTGDKQRVRKIYGTANSNLNIQRGTKQSRHWEGSEHPMCLSCEACQVLSWMSILSLPLPRSLSLSLSLSPWALRASGSPGLRPSSLSMRPPAPSSGWSCFQIYVSHWPKLEFHSITMFRSAAKGEKICCAVPFCSETVTACPETRDDPTAAVYCLRAQGWTKPKNSSHVYCPGHRTTERRPQYGEHYNHADCLRRHTGGAAATAASTTSFEAPPPPPPLELEQCCDTLCSVGYQVCGICNTRMVAWTAQAHALTPLEEHTHQLIDTLNCLPANLLPPEFICDITDKSLRRLGSHEPEVGRGDDREADAGNKAGSALMLAALLPRVYGIETAGPLRIFGTPPPQCLTVISSTRAKSGRGPDNRRHNAWEALLNHWQDNPTMAYARDLLSLTLYEMTVAIELQVDPENTSLCGNCPGSASMLSESPCRRA